MLVYIFENVSLPILSRPFSFSHLNNYGNLISGHLASNIICAKFTLHADVMFSLQTYI